ncbi:hypothetical protein [Pontibacter pamirensis]|uniref:hypothetical protein n=1 Tax=Pontibacter pamirensis TaxID=2562824 RepID=UPI001F46B36D|nr:hypothetical protein [Pontibacter pamirensis]
MTLVTLASPGRRMGEKTLKVVEKDSMIILIVIAFFKLRGSSSIENKGVKEDKGVKF